MEHVLDEPGVQVLVGRVDDLLEEPVGLLELVVEEEVGLAELKLLQVILLHHRDAEDLVLKSATRRYVIS